MDPVIKAAKELVRERGEEFTVDELAELAGVSRSTVYRRHGGRSGVLEKLNEHGVEVAPSVSARERLLEATKRIVGQQGRLDATVDEIADEAGVSAMTVFRIFGDKNSLLQAFFATVTPRRVTIPALAEDTAPIDEVLERVANVTVSFAREYPGLIRLATNGQTGPEVLGDLRRMQGSTREALVSYFAAQIDRGTIAAEDPFEPAAHFAAALIAEALVAPALGGELESEAAAKRAVRRFLLGFGAGDA